MTCNWVILEFIKNGFTKTGGNKNYKFASLINSFGIKNISVNYFKDLAKFKLQIHRWLILNCQPYLNPLNNYKLHQIHDVSYVLELIALTISIPTAINYTFLPSQPVPFISVGYYIKNSNNIFFSTLSSISTL